MTRNDRPTHPSKRDESLAAVGLQGLCTGGVTHYLAASRAVYRRIAPRIQAPCAILHPPVPTEFYRPASQDREGFYLVVDRGNATGRTALAVAACRLAKRELVVIGAGAKGFAHTRSHDPHCIHLGPQPPEVIRDHYRRCRAVLFPGVSDFESSVVEAQACGTPVIAFHQGGAIELVRDAEGSGPGTGLFFNEPNSWSLASAIRELERRPQKCEPGLAVAHAVQFSSARFEREIDAFVASVLSRGEGNDRLFPANRQGDDARGDSDRPERRRSAA